MNLNLLQAFQTAVNEHGLGDDNTHVRMFRRDDQQVCYSRVVRERTSDAESNREVRIAFKQALTSAFGVDRLDELPPEVKKVLKIGDFRLSKAGEVRSSRPLTMRRVKAVMGAVRNLAESTARDSGEARMIDSAFTSNFRETDAMERALARIAIVSGRQPMMFTLPNGRNVAVELSSLAEYTKGIASADLVANIDDLHDQIEGDLRLGCSVYENLCAGKDCTSTNEARRALRHYLSFMALESGKSGRSRVVSVPDPTGKVADFLKAADPAAARRLWANESVTGASDRVIFTSELKCLGKATAPMRQKDIEMRYRKVMSNPMASALLRRQAAQGGLTIAQMLVNVKAEIERIATVGEEDLVIDARLERKDPSLTIEKNAAAVGSTKAFERSYSLRSGLQDLFVYILSTRDDLDHPEMRVGDEIVLTKEFLGKYSKEEDDVRVLSPRNTQRSRPSSAQSFGQPASASVSSASPVSPSSPAAGTDEWIKEQIAQCGMGNVGRGLEYIVNCLRTGCCPKGKVPPSEFNRRQMNGTEIPGELMAYLKQLDREWFADLVWYVKSSAAEADSVAIRIPVGSTGPAIPRPLWSALRYGHIDRDFPVEICKEMVNLFKADNRERPVRTRIANRPLRKGESEPPAGNIIKRAAVCSWGFGTYDVERILRFVKDCGCRIEEMSAADLGRLSAVAAIHDYKLEDAAMFFQRQTGKTPVEATNADLERLFRLKWTGALNDAGAGLKGVSGEIVAILKGEKLPSMTRAVDKDVMQLLAELRMLEDGEPNSARFAEFLGKKVSFRLTLSGALVFNVDGFEFRAAKTPREFIEMIEDDVVGNVGKFGLGSVYKTLPQIRGAEVSSDPVVRSRSRELCLRYLKGAAGIDPSVLASVGTREIFRMAEGVADGRYCLRSGRVSERAIRTMLDRTIDRNAMTSKDAAELCDSISGMRTVTGVEMGAMVAQMPSPRPAMRPEVKLVHEFLADLVFDSNPFDFDKARRDNPDARVPGIMRRHIPALVAIAKDPRLLSTFPADIIGDIGDVIGLGLQFLPPQFVKTVSDEELARTFEFLVDNVSLPARERPAAVDRFLKGSQSSAAASKPADPKPAAKPSSSNTASGKSLFGMMGGFVSGLFSSSKPEVSKSKPPAAPNMPRPFANAAKRHLLLATLDQMSKNIAGVDRNIELGVASAMVSIQETLSEQIGTMTEVGASQDPVWSMEFDEIVGGAMSDSGSGYGMFMNKVLTTYFTASPIVDQRRMLSSFIRQVHEGTPVGVMAGALFKGAGPLLQKMLQGLPPAALGKDLSCALEDMKSNLLPIPTEFVAASMKRIVDRSGGRIRSIRVERSLGAASVGQAFLCKMFTAEHPEGEECVVKLLRPTVKTAIIRERAIFEAAAAEVPGMAKTFAGQFARILDELDFTLEATNVNFGRSVYEQPVYLRQNSLFSNTEIQTFNLTSLHSMEVHPLVTPTMGCLVLKKAPGDTYDRFMKEKERRLGELLEGLNEENGKYVFATHAESLRYRKELTEMYNATLTRQKFLIDLTMKWVHEGLFGNGFYHGDLHAGNIMTDGKGLTVIDFGNATHLTSMERSHVLRMISAALVGWNGMFETSFKALLSDEGRAQFDAANSEGKVSRDLAEVLNKGTGMDVGMRIAAALMLLQKHGIEVPGAIYNFNQCQMRLGGTVDAMNHLLGRIEAAMSRLSAPRFVYETPEDAGERPSAQLFSAIAGLTDAFMGYFEKPFEPESTKDAQEWMQGILADLNSGHEPDSMRQQFFDELNDDEYCRLHIYPFIEQLQKIKALDVNGALQVKSGAGIELAKTYAEFREKREHSKADREKLGERILDVVKTLNIIALSFQSQELGGKPVSFLEAVGSGISDSLYTVRTTLGNITSMKLRNEQEAEAGRIKQANDRMRLSDLRVAAYLETRRNGAAIDEDAVLAIKEIAGKMSLPFDLPGLDGSKAWLDSYPAHCKIFEAILLNIKKLLDELHNRGVFDRNTTIEAKKEASCVAMQYLVDRFGGLFEAFGNLDNHMRQVVVVRLGDFLTSDRARRVDGVMDLDRNECAMAALLYLFMGGMQPLQGGEE